MQSSVSLVEIIGTIFAGLTLGVAGLTLYAVMAKPKLRMAPMRFSKDSAFPSAGDSYVADLVIFNDGRKEANAATIRLCLPPGWGLTGCPEGSECHAASPDDSVPGWAIFDLRIREPLYRGRNERRYVRITSPKPGDARPEAIKWRAVYEGGSNPREGYFDLPFTCR